MNIKHNQGFTFIELAIYMGLLAILMVVFTDILVGTLNVQTSSQSVSSVTEDGRYIYSRFIYDIERAQAVSLPANLGDVSNSIQLTIGGNPYTYALDGNNLMLTDPTGTYQLNSSLSSISNLSFTRIGNPGGKHTFRINFTISSVTLSHSTQQMVNFQTTAGLR